jgi:hypothetical protein
VAALVTAHVARVKALPPDYQIVYKETQKYLAHGAVRGMGGLGVSAEQAEGDREVIHRFDEMAWPAWTLDGPSPPAHP